MTRPLEGTRVVVTRARAQAAELANELEALGAQVLLVPTVEIGDPASWDGVDDGLRDLGEGVYEWVLFASVNAVRKVVARAGAVDSLLEAKTAAVGPATAAALEEGGITPHVVPKRSDASMLALALRPGRGRVLWPRVENGPRGPVDALESLGWKVDEVAAYSNVPANTASEDFRHLRDGRFDIITFTSPSTVRNLVAHISPSEVGIDPGSDGPRRVACIGPSTSEAARDSGVRVDGVATEQSVKGLVNAVCALKMGA